MKQDDCRMFRSWASGGSVCVAAAAALIAFRGSMMSAIKVRLNSNEGCFVVRVSVRFAGRHF